MEICASTNPRNRVEELTGHPARWDKELLQELSFRDKSRAEKLPYTINGMCGGVWGGKPPARFVFFMRYTELPVIKVYSERVRTNSLLM